MEMTVSVVEMIMMMISMKSSSMTVTMATISPLRKGISPADFCLPESSFLSGVFRLEEAAMTILDVLPALRVSG